MYIYRHSRYIQRLDECMSSLIMMENLLPCPSVTIFFIYPSNSKNICCDSISRFYNPYSSPFKNPYLYKLLISL